MVNDVISYSHFLHSNLWKLVEIPEIKLVTSLIIFINNNSTKLCQITLRIKRFNHQRKLFFSAAQCRTVSLQCVGMA